MLVVPLVVWLLILLRDPEARGLLRSAVLHLAPSSVRYTYTSKYYICARKVSPKLIRSDWGDCHEESLMKIATLGILSVTSREPHTQSIASFNGTQHSATFCHVSNRKYKRILKESRY